MDREAILKEATRRIMENSNYDPHFANVGERELMENRLFLARYDAVRRIQDTPIKMILWCERCGAQHIDMAEDHKPGCNDNPCNCGAWRNPPHKSHLCHSCGYVWRPADVPTTGVADINTRGQHDHTPPIRRQIGS